MDFSEVSAKLAARLGELELQNLILTAQVDKLTQLLNERKTEVVKDQIKK